MIRVLFLALVVFAAWQAKLHHATLFDRRPRHELVVENRGAVALNRLRVTVGNQTLVREVVAPGASATFDFTLERDATFRVVWIWANRTTDFEWHGGHAYAGRLARHTLRIAPERTVHLDAVDLAS